MLSLACPFFTGSAGFSGAVLAGITHAAPRLRGDTEIVHGFPYHIY